MRVLVAEDDRDLAEELREDLRAAGYAMDWAQTGTEAERLGDVEAYDAVILDLGLPERPGLDVLRHWRSHGNLVPVIILTARDAWHEKVQGFRAGADDYVAKPFHMPELLARLGAVVRRRFGLAPVPLRTDRWSLDEERQCATLADGTTVALTATEFRLLRCFMLHPGKLLSKAKLGEHVYADGDQSDSNVIEVYVNRLRRKLGAEVIRTQRGQGYVFGSP